MYWRYGCIAGYQDCVGHFEALRDMWKGDIALGCTLWSRSAQLVSIVVTLRILVIE